MRINWLILQRRLERRSVCEERTGAAPEVEFGLPIQFSDDDITFHLNPTLLLDGIKVIRGIPENL
jgi:hypothetical protein